MNPGSPAFSGPPRKRHHLAGSHDIKDDEDARFLRLAREALVATATANLRTSNLNPLEVDPTISDLLDRLQYALSPHGNPMRLGLDIHANENGQLMIQNFYRQFPNMSNDIFVGLASSPVGTNYDHQPGQPHPSRPHVGRGLPRSQLSLPNLNQNHHAPHTYQNHQPHQNSTELSSGSNHHPSARGEGWNFLVGEPLELRAPAHTDKSASGTPEFDEDERKFFCTHCSMSFRRSSDLKRHEKQHFKMLPYICDQCGKSFARKDALKRHVGTLTCKRNTDKRLYVDNLEYLKTADREE